MKGGGRVAHTHLPARFLAQRLSPPKAGSRFPGAAGGAPPIEKLGLDEPGLHGPCRMELHHAPAPAQLSSSCLPATFFFRGRGQRGQRGAAGTCPPSLCGLQSAKWRDPFIIRWNGLGIQDLAQSEAERERELESSIAKAPPRIAPSAAVPSIVMGRLCCRERRSWSTPAFSFSSSPLRGSLLQIGMAGWLDAAGARQNPACGCFLPMGRRCLAMLPVD